MAGQTVTRAHFAKLDKLGEQAVFDQIANGRSTTATQKWAKVGNRAFYKWLDLEDGRRERYQAARRMWADRLAEETIEIADNADISDAQVAKLRVETRKWVAERGNPDHWGIQKQPLVSLTVNDSHRSALRGILDSGHLIEEKGG